MTRSPGHELKCVIQVLASHTHTLSFSLSEVTEQACGVKLIDLCPKLPNIKCKMQLYHSSPYDNCMEQASLRYLLDANDHTRWYSRDTARVIGADVF